MTYTRNCSLGNYLPTYLVEAMHILNRNFFGRAITYLFHFQCWCQNSILAQKTRYLIRGTLQKFFLEVIYLIMGFAAQCDSDFLYNDQFCLGRSKTWDQNFVNWHAWLDGNDAAFGAQATDLWYSYGYYRYMWGFFSLFALFFRNGLNSRKVWLNFKLPQSSSRENNPM